MKRLLIFLGIIAVFAYSCETDFDVTADYKDITIVYGLLSQNDTVQYIRINRAFLGDGNALEMAAIPDSSYYPFGAIEVWIEEWKDGRFVGSFQLEETTLNSKEPGIFPYPEQRIWFYRTYPGTASEIDEDSEYRLFIKNNLTGKTSTGITDIVTTFSIERPIFPLQLGLAYEFEGK
ncbi:MAG: hypothetical protein KKA07_18185, partial [Bacteroidetes bacterium]|nr:hypothetical protein [Bacteroidota bacterium]